MQRLRSRSEYGNNGGTVINIMMKQGGNQLHGSGWYLFGYNPILWGCSGHEVVLAERIVPLSDQIVGACLGTFAPMPDFYSLSATFAKHPRFLSHHHTIHRAVLWPDHFCTVRKIPAWFCTPPMLLCRSRTRREGISGPRFGPIVDPRLCRPRSCHRLRISFRDPVLPDSETADARIRAPEKQF